MSKVLLVDGYPLVVEGCEYALSRNVAEVGEVICSKAFGCASAKEMIDIAIDDKELYDLAIVDFSLPNKSGGLQCNGEAVVSYLQERIPSCKIIVLTGYTEVIKIYNIVKNVRPDGLISKREVTIDNLLDVAKIVMSGQIYYSPMVKQCIEEIVNKEIMYDDYNRDILLLLSKGYRLLDLEGQIPLSLPAIKKRLAKMKQVFGVTDTSGLLRVALELGFV